MFVRTGPVVKTRAHLLSKTCPSLPGTQHVRTYWSRSEDESTPPIQSLPFPYQAHSMFVRTGPVVKTRAHLLSKTALPLPGTQHVVRTGPVVKTRAHLLSKTCLPLPGTQHVRAYWSRSEDEHTSYPKPAPSSPTRHTACSYVLVP